MIGAGFFARFQAEAWKRIDSVELVAVADPQSTVLPPEHGIDAGATWGKVNPDELE